MCCTDRCTPSGPAVVSSNSFVCPQQGIPLHTQHSLTASSICVDFRRCSDYTRVFTIFTTFTVWQPTAEPRSQSLQSHFDAQFELQQTFKVIELLPCDWLMSWFEPTSHPTTIWNKCLVVYIYLQGAAMREHAQTRTRTRKLLSKM